MRAGIALLAVMLGFGTFARAQDCKGDPVFDIHYENIQTTIKEAGDYKPGSRDYYVQDFNDDQNEYLKASLSAKRRKAWLDKWEDAKLVPCFSAALDQLAAVAKKTLPTYKPSGYTIRNPAEEKLMRDAVNDIQNATVISSGIKEASWKIEKNDLGIPTARYKHGMIYAKYSTSDDGFCRIVYVNILQDYAGGGTYGDSYGRLIKSEFAGCP